jgi:ABC-type uncharacterized transport system, ATPase component
MEIFRADNVEKRFATHLALDDVSIAVPANSIFGLLGPNGAGKTTLIRIINQITAPDKGTLFFEGRPLKADDIYQIGYLPEERGLYKKMKVGDQALYLAQLKGLSKHDAMEKLKYWFRKFEIQAWWDKKVEELSKGMAQKIQFIVTIIHEPKLLIFDEPFSGFDPINTNLLKEEILNLKANGSTIIFSTHNMGSVEELCDNITLINKSRNILSGQIDTIRQQYGENKFEIGYRGGEDLKQALTSDYVLEKEWNEKMMKKAVIKVLNPSQENRLISQLMPHMEILSFNEIIPSMNDVFIKVVQNYNSQNKN